MQKIILLFRYPCYTMQLFLINSILIISTLFCFVRADAITDAIHIKGLASSTADTIFASLNGTAYLVSIAGLDLRTSIDDPQNTSDLVSQVTAAIQGADSLMMSNIVRHVLFSIHH